MAASSTTTTTNPTPNPELALLQKILIIGFAILAILMCAQLGGCGAQVTAHLPPEWGNRLYQILEAVQPPEEEEPEPETATATPPAAPAAPEAEPPVQPEPSQLDRIEGAIGAIADQVEKAPITKWVRGGTFASRSVARHASGRYSVWMPEAGGNWCLASEKGKHLAVLVCGKWVNVFLLEDVDRAFATD